MKAKNGFRETQRDLLLLRTLADYEYMTTKQLSEKVFSGVRKTTVLRRLRKLESEKRVRRISGLASYELLWTITEYGAHRVGLDHHIGKINYNHLEHDALVTEARIIFEKSSAVSSWLSEQQLRRSPSERQRYQINPDGLFTFETLSGSKVGALEVEITSKTASKYDEVLSNYLCKKKISLVCYATKSDQFGQSLARRWAKLEARKPEKGARFFWITVEELRKSSEAIELKSIVKPIKFPL